jgi:hypothetical protein
MARKSRSVAVLGETGQIAVQQAPKIDPLAPDPKEAVPYTAEIAEYIVREIAKGSSLVDICRSDDMPHSVTFLKWASTMPELNEQYLAAKRYRAHRRIEDVECVVNALDPHTTDKNTAYVTDIKAKNLIRLAEIGDPASFSPKMQMMHQHSGSLVNITLDLSAPQSRQVTDITAEQVTETPKLDKPQSGLDEGEVKG